MQEEAPNAAFPADCTQKAGAFLLRKRPSQSISTTPGYQAMTSLAWLTKVVAACGSAW